MSTIVTCMIVDDEPLARGVIRTLLGGYLNWQIVYECTTAVDAWQQLAQHEVQVMFLDIQMPGVLGTDFLRSLKNPPLTIFTTAFANYAVEAFELHAFDYLLKPITASRLEQTIQNVEQTLNQVNTPVLKPSEDLSSDHIFVKSAHKQVKILYSDILFLEAQRDTTKFYLKKNQTILTNFHLKILEELLPTDKFIRVHRSYVISLNEVNAVNGNILEIEGYQVPVGGSFKSLTMKALNL